MLSEVVILLVKVPNNFAVQTKKRFDCVKKNWSCAACQILQTLNSEFLCSWTSKFHGLLNVIPGTEGHVYSAHFERVY